MELRWTKTFLPAPDRPGWYWFRWEKGVDPEVLLVTEEGIYSSDVLYLWEQPDAWPGDVAREAYAGGEWAGPIGSPLEPEETE
jgi:hypothetical protein